MGVPQQYCNNTKQLNFQLPYQDLSLTQSTVQSYPEVASMQERNPCREGILSPQSGLILSPFVSIFLFFIISVLCKCSMFLVNICMFFVFIRVTILILDRMKRRKK